MFPLLKKHIAEYLKTMMKIWQAHIHVLSAYAKVLRKKKIFLVHHGKKTKKKSREKSHFSNKICLSS
jgi:hypothetical protein